jgi:hypothetical protein
MCLLVKVCIQSTDNNVGQYHSKRINNSPKFSICAWVLDGGVVLIILLIEKLVEGTMLTGTFHYIDEMNNVVMSLHGFSGILLVHLFM